MRIIALSIAVLMGAWLSFDGTRALMKGDYVTRGGQLGPWARAVNAVGISPRGTPMKIVHVVLGIAWLSAACLFMAKFPAGRSALLACSFLSLWYVPLGTLMSVVEIALLLVPAWASSE